MHRHVSNSKLITPNEQKSQNYHQFLPSNRSKMNVSTPELLWHGGANEGGKPDPVYSVDLHPKENILLTSGIDCSIPPKGSVRLWKVESGTSGQEFLIDLSDHGSAVNIARFSPCGKMLASASDKQIVIYELKEGGTWSSVTEMKDLNRIWLRPSLSELFDMEWSPDSKHLVFGAIDSKAEILRIGGNRDSLVLTGHQNYVQGVAWDPLNTMVVTQSNDRSVKVHQLKTKENCMVKLAQRGHTVIKMHGGFASPVSVADKDRALTAEDFGVVTNEKGETVAIAKETGINLYADSYVPSFFRRLSFTPDGLLLITPTGVHRPPTSKTTPSAKTGTSSTAQTSLPGQNKSFCTHIYSRNQLTSPCVSLVGLDEPSVAVRVCPRLFKMRSVEGDQSTPLFPGDYRMIFAVVTLKTILLYDTQHHAPFASFANLHFAPINDCTWAGDGRMLIACSSDGYLTFVRFPVGSLGEMLDDTAVPEAVKRTHPCLYNYTPPAVVIPTTAVAASVVSSATPSTCSTPIHTTEVDTSSTVEMSTPAAESTNNEEKNQSDKKRKRIQPTMVSNLDGSSSCSRGNMNNGIASEMETETTIVDTGDVEKTVTSEEITPVVVPAVVGKKEKKRIAPMLVSTSPQAVVAAPIVTESPVV